MRQYVKVKLEKAIGKIIYDLHQEYETKTLVTTEENQKEIDKTIDKLSHLIHDQLKNNS